MDMIAVVKMVLDVKPINHVKEEQVKLKDGLYRAGYFNFLSGVHFSVIVKVLFDRSILVLLILRDEIIHVGLGLGELHLVHALTSVPVEESLPPEHGGELLGDSLEDLLDGGGVSYKLQS